jgi:2-keto-4-pentenoate hydratase
MSMEQTAEAIWKSHQAGVHFPDSWVGKLSLDDAYRVQQDILKRKLGQGGKQAGWKVGLSATVARDMFGAKSPVFGYLLEANRHRSGHSFSLAGMITPLVESEVLVVLGKDLPGPDATPEKARAAVKEICPAFEIIERRGDMRVDLPLGVADNVMQKEFVVGPARALAPNEDLGEVRVEVWINGKMVDSVLGREAMDNPINSLAWLANTVHRFGGTLKAGQCILTGTFTKPNVVAQGDRIESRFSGLGTVSTSFK